MCDVFKHYLVYKLKIVSNSSCTSDSEIILRKKKGKLLNDCWSLGYSLCPSTSRFCSFLKNEYRKLSVSLWDIRNTTTMDDKNKQCNAQATNVNEKRSHHEIKRRLG